MFKFFNKTRPINPTGKIPRPEILKGSHMKQVQSDLCTAVVLACCGMMSYYALMLKKKENYLHFYKNVDQEEAFERMRKAGLLQCSENFKNDE